MKADRPLICLSAHADGRDLPRHPQERLEPSLDAAGTIVYFGRGGPFDRQLAFNTLEKLTYLCIPFPRRLLCEHYPKKASLPFQMPAVCVPGHRGALDRFCARLPPQLRRWQPSPGRRCAWVCLLGTALHRRVRHEAVMAVAVLCVIQRWQVHPLHSWRNTTALPLQQRSATLAISRTRLYTIHFS